jgi:Holliday junction resolvase-like predicted endonuclease
MEELKKIVANTSREVSNLSSRWGQFVENLVAPGVLRLFREREINVQEVAQRMRSARGSRHLEIDVFAVDDDVAVVVEVKSRLTQNDVRQVLNTLTHFKAAFPHYATYQIYGAVAAIEIDKDVDTYAYNQGLFVIVQSGDSIMISNTSDFRPRIW